MKPPFLIFLAALAGGLASAGVAQDPKSEIPVVRTSNPDKGAAQQKAGDGAGATVVEDDVLANERKLAGQSDDSGEGGKNIPSEPVIPNDLAFHMAPVLSFQPRRIAPGATGDACLVLSMQQGAVLAVGSAFRLEYAREQGPVRLGEWVLGDPAIGAEDGAFKGRPVYESYAQVRIPVQVEPGAAHRNYPVMLRIIAEVTDGRTGGRIKESSAQARAELAVGPALPTPVVAGGAPAVRPAAVDPAPDAATPGDGADEPEVTRVDREPVGAERAAPDRRATDEPGAGAPPFQDLPVGDGDRTIVWVGGGAGLLVLVLAIAALRRR